MRLVPAGDDMGVVNDGEMKKTAKAWLAYQETKAAQYEWAMHRKEEWFAPAEATPADYAIMSSFVRQVCHDVSGDDRHGIDIIGAGPLEDFIHAFPDQALRWVEEEAETNVTLREALTGVWSRGRGDVRERIDEILGRYGKAGASR
jgi:hypothetical protein